MVALCAFFQVEHGHLTSATLVIDLELWTIMGAGPVKARPCREATDLSNGAPFSALIKQGAKGSFQTQGGTQHRLIENGVVEVLGGAVLLRSHR